MSISAGYKDTGKRHLGTDIYKMVKEGATVIEWKDEAGVDKISRFGAQVPSGAEKFIDVVYADEKWLNPEYHPFASDIHGMMPPNSKLTRVVVETWERSL